MGITIVTGRQPVAPNSATNRTNKVARQGQVGNRRVSTRADGVPGTIREQVNDDAAVTPCCDRAIGLVPDDPALVPITWFTERLPAGAERGGNNPDSFQLLFGSELLADDMRNVVNFAQKIDQDIVRASTLLEKSELNPLSEKEQHEVATLLNAGKYNLAQVQGWTSVVGNELQEYPVGLDFITKLQERLADRHMDLADLMCLYDIDQAPPEQAVSRADRIDYSLVAADAALKVAGGLTVLGLSGVAKQQLVDALESHRAALSAAKDVAIGAPSNSDSSQVLSKAVWSSSFDLTKGKQHGGKLFLNYLHKHWDAKAAGASGSWLPLDRYKVTEGEMLEEFVKYQLKQAGVAKKHMPDLEFQFKAATVQTLNERAWEPIDKELNYSVAGGEARTAYSKITPAKAMAGHFAKDLPANGVCCSDRMQYTHVPNLARTELIDEYGDTIISALRHGVLDAYDISASNLRKLPKHELNTMVRELLFPHWEAVSVPHKPDTQEAPDIAKAIAGAESPLERPSSISNKIAYKGEINNTCPEECALFAANYFNLDCQFETYKNADQIDIFLPLSMSITNTDGTGGSFVGGNSDKGSFNYLMGLDQQSIHLMRTGQNGGAGHNQILYSKSGEWYAYDSAENQSQLTSGGSLTVAGKDRMVKEYAKWGLNHGESAITTVPVTEQGARALIGYIKDYRNSGEDVAMERLFNRNDGAAEQPHSSADLDLDHQMQQQMQQQMRKVASESPYNDMGFDDVDSKNDANVNSTVELSYGDDDYATVKRHPSPDLPASYSDEVLASTVTPAPATERDAEIANQISHIVNEIRTNPTRASFYASAMRTVASENMAKELAVAALVSDPDKLQSALDGELTELTLSSISLLTPDRGRAIMKPRSNEYAMLQHQTAALQKLNDVTDLQVRDASGELRTVEVDCKVRTFNFGVNAGAVGRARGIPSHTRGWDKLMGWGYAMKQNNPELQSLFGNRESLEIGGEVAIKLMELGGVVLEMEAALKLIEADVFATNSNPATAISDLESGIVDTSRHMEALLTDSKEVKKIWREGSYNKGGQDPYKMVSRLGMVITELGETLAFNCKSGKDRSGQLDAELKYLAAHSTATGDLPDIGAPATPELRQMRSNFTLNSGNLEMQRMNTGLPGFKLNIKEVPGLANFIDGAELEPIYHGGAKYVKA